MKKTRFANPLTSSDCELDALDSIRRLSTDVASASARARLAMQAKLQKDREIREVRELELAVEMSLAISDGSGAGPSWAS
jgi:hypothetical protein